LINYRPNPLAPFPPPPAPSYKEGEKEKLFLLEGGTRNAPLLIGEGLGERFF